MIKESEEYRLNMLRSMENKYDQSKPPEVLEAEEVIAKFSQEQERARAVILRLKTTKCPSSECFRCFFLRGLSVDLKAIPGDDNFDRFRCPKCKATYETPT